MKKFFSFVFVFLLSAFLIGTTNVKAIEDNPLSHLEVQTNEGQGNFNLSSGSTSFTFSIRATMDYVNIIATPKDSSYVVTGAGKVNCENGANTINVVVTDPKDNTSKTYTINLNFIRVNSLTDDNGNPNSGAFVNYALLGIGIIGGSYLLIISKKKKTIYNI